MKYVGQRHVLGREFKKGDGPIAIVMDEAHNLMTEFDAIFTNEARSHGGLGVG